MTNGEAVKNLKILEKRWTEDEDMFSPTITIEIDEEFMQSIYKAISALEKQIPKKPNYEGDGYADGAMVYDIWRCPNCDRAYEVDYDNYEYCPNCGQKIDWSKEDDRTD